MAPGSYRMGLVTGGFLTALAMLAAAAMPRDNPTTVSVPVLDQVAPGTDDLAMIQTVLAEARGASLMMCEMAAGTMRGNIWWRNREPVDDDVRDMLQWVRQDPTDFAVIPVLAGAMADSDRCVARTAARFLGRMEQAQANDRLLEALRDTSPQVREMAAMGLGVAEPETALAPLVSALSDDVEPRVRVMAAWALGELENPEAIEPLSRALTDGPPPLRRAAASALGEIEHTDAVPVLIRAVSDPDAIVRTHAAWSLGEIEDHAAVEALSRALLTDQVPEVRVAAARALGAIEE
jgi:HEAT repeat protein